jgi:glucose/arabinose dehydrogenase
VKRLAVAIALLAASCGVSSSRASSVYARGLTHASAFAFDATGRLWVATADFSDQGKDGVYVVPAAGSVPVEVISGLHTPLGLLWRNDTLLVASKERVDAYSGLDGDHFHFASTKQLVSFPSGVGEVNGLVASPDGRVRLGISAPCDHCQPTLPMSGSIVSFQPDGSDVRVEVTKMRAPINLAYRPNTSDLYVTMNQRDDLGKATPGDWLAKVSAGQSWGFPDCYGQGGSVCDGVPKPTAVLDKHAAVSGLVFLGPSAYVAEWSSGKVLRVSLPGGQVSTFFTKAKNPEPLAATDDGSLLVGDWSSGVVYRTHP